MLTKSVVRAVGVLVLLSLGVWLWQTLVRPGLVGDYYAEGGWRGTPRFTVVDATPSTATLGARATRLDDVPFSVSWRGFVLIPDAGDHTFNLRSSGEAWLFLDDELLVDNGGAHDTVTASAARPLTAGLHAIEVRFQGTRDDPTLELTVAFGAHPPMALSGDRLFQSRASYLLRRATVIDGYALPLLWSLTALGLALWWPVRHVVRHCRTRSSESGVNTALWVLLAGSLLLNVCGIWWGLPQFWTWAPDEVLPFYVVDALRAGFGGGWHEIYPPLQYYLLGIVYLPFELAGRVGIADIWADHGYVVLFLLARLLSALMGVVTVYVVYLCALELGRTRTAGLCSAFLVALMPPFVFYSSTANVDVPQLCWFALSLLFYIRAVRTDQVHAYALFAVTGMLAVCTKDQAYGFYVLPAVHLIWHRYRSVSRTNRGGMRALAVDRRIWLATGCAVLVFALGHNLVFNFDGFLQHAKIIVDDASTDFQIWERTLAGHLSMGWAALGQLWWSLGIPAFVACVIGVAHPRARRDLFLLLPVVSYYLCFISVVMYHYDRFFLGVCLVLALFGGPWLAAQAAGVSRGRWRRAGVAIVLLYTLFNGALVDLMLVNDARYDVERWLRQPQNATGAVGMAGFDIYMPRFDGVRTIELGRSWQEVQDTGPRFIVINQFFSCREEPGSEEAEFYVRLRDPAEGYQQVMASRYDPWWPPVESARVWQGECPRPLTNLVAVNPEIQVYERVGAAP